MRRKALLAAAALALTGFVPAAPAAAARPTHVAIVIAGHGVACVPWHSGITGDEVLNDVATVRYRPSDGLITQIDGTPSNNRADETHYWSYWHNTGAGWRYSTLGASAYHPNAGTVEGWHFINGAPHATPPPVRSYASICHDTASAPPAPRPPPSTTAAPASTSARSSHATTAVHTSTSRGRPTSVGTATRPTEAKPTTVPARPTSATTTTTAVAPASSALPTLRARNTADGPRSDTGSALPTVLAVVVVLVLGGIAAVVMLRRRRNT